MCTALTDVIMAKAKPVEADGETLRISLLAMRLDVVRTTTMDSHLKEVCADSINRARQIVNERMGLQPEPRRGR